MKEFQKKREALIQEKMLKKINRDSILQLINL